MASLFLQHVTACAISVQGFLYVILDSKLDSKAYFFQVFSELKSIFIATSTVCSKLCSTQCTKSAQIFSDIATIEQYY